MNILLLKGFNNYFNRTVKKYSTLADYKNNSSSFLQFANINFNPNDGVVTELIIGNEAQVEITGQDGMGHITTGPLSWDQNGTPDYLICYETSGTPSVNTIKFRWFVLEAERTRNGQYRIALKRDIIAEYLNEILNAPCFIEKGNVAANSDPMLFNSEQMAVNQIKQSELLLKDKTGCGWVVGYVSQDKTRYPASDYYESSSPVSIYEDYTDVPTLIKNIQSLGTIQAPVIREQTSWGIPAGRVKMKVSWNCLKSPAKYQDISFTNVPWLGEMTYTSPTTTVPASNGYMYAAWGGEQVIDNNTYPGDGAIAFLNAVKINATLRSYYINNVLTNGMDLTAANFETVNDWNGRYFKKDSKMYKVQITYGARTMGPAWAINGGTTYYTALETVFNSFTQTGTFFNGNSSNLATSLMRFNGASSGTKFCDLSWEYQTIKVEFIEVPVDAGDVIKTYIPASRIQTCDTPMDVFAIPYSDAFEIYTAVDAETGDPDPTSVITMSKQLALQAAITMAQAGANVYDIQVLPYFPNPELVNESEIYENQFVIPNSSQTADVNYNFIYNSANAPIGIVFWSRTSVFSTDIDEQLSLADTNALTLKVSNTCDLFRLTSPNYAGSFEFSLAKSGGRVTKFNADCTYKPFTPYIHVTPDLAGLYGENFNAIDDARGLICGGDFSIARYTNAWEQYELQNKNYQNIFDRQIQNLDVNNKIAMEQQDWKNMQGVFGGILGGGAGGAIGGLKAAGPYGAIAGAILGTAYGTAMGEIGAIKQTDWLQRSQAETKDYTKDMYGYNLGNIQALPNALAKTTALTNNNKVFPFVEYFTCTDAEREAFKDKIKYNGMTIMKIGSLGNYSISSDYDRVYIKGQLIRLDNINDDFHIADAIFQEVNKGFFILQ